MAVSAKTRLLAVPSIALLSLGILAGCGDDAPSFDEGSSSASASASSAAASSAEAAETREAAAEAVIPDGYKAVTAPNNKISFAVPESWAEMDSEALANADEVEAYLKEAAGSTDFTAEELQESMAQLDLIATALEPDENNFSPNVNVEAAPASNVSFPTESDLEGIISASGGVAGEYRTIETPLGQAAALSYDLNSAGMKIKGVVLAVPNGEADTYSVITVSSTNADTSNELADAIAASLSQAS